MRNGTSGRATGVVFDEPSVAGLSDALTRTLALYAQPTVFRALLTNGMRQPVGWDAAAADMIIECAAY